MVGGAAAPPTIVIDNTLFLQTVSVVELYILHVELDLGLAAPVVFFELVTDFEHLLAAYAVVVFAQLACQRDSSRAIVVGTEFGTS